MLQFPPPPKGISWSHRENSPGDQEKSLGETFPGDQEKFLGETSPGDLQICLLIFDLTSASDQEKYFLHTPF